MTAIGGCALGPTMAIWYELYVDRSRHRYGTILVLTIHRYRCLQNRIQLRSKFASTVARVAADQLVFAPISIVGLFALVQLSKPTSDSVVTRLELARNQVKSNLSDVLVQNYKLWPGKNILIYCFSDCES